MMPDLRAMFTKEQWAEIGRQVQFCEISWPIGVQLIKTVEEAQEAIVSARPEVICSDKGFTK